MFRTRGHIACQPLAPLQELDLLRLLRPKALQRPVWSSVFGAFGFVSANHRRRTQSQARWSSNQNCSRPSYGTDARSAGLWFWLWYKEHRQTSQYLHPLLHLNCRNQNRSAWLCEVGSGGEETRWFCDAVISGRLGSCSATEMVRLERALQAFPCFLQSFSFFLSHTRSRWETWFCYKLLVDFNNTTDRRCTADRLVVWREKSGHVSKTQGGGEGVLRGFLQEWRRADNSIFTQCKAYSTWLKTSPKFHIKFKFSSSFSFSSPSPFHFHFHYYFSFSFFISDHVKRTTL